MSETVGEVPGDIVAILSGTRSELGETTVGVANIYERPERAGELSCLLVLPDGKAILSAGDEVGIDGARFRLLQFVDGEHGRSAVFRRVADEPSQVRRSLSGGDKRIEVDLPSEMTATSLARSLREATRTVLSVLGPPPPSLKWIEGRSRQTFREWNGGETGPSTTTRWEGEFDTNPTQRLKASVSIVIVRWSPDEIYQTEVSAFWRNDDRSGSVFSRAGRLLLHRTISIANLDDLAMRTLAETLREADKG